MTSRFLPDRDTPIIVNGVLQRQSESDIASALPREDGSGRVTFGGTIADGNVLTLTFTSKLFTGGSLDVQVTATDTDTATTLAVKFAVAIMANATLANLLTANANYVAAGRLDITVPGPLGSHVTISGESTGAETFTIVQVAGGSGPIIPTADFKFTHNGTVISFTAERRMSLSSDAISALVAAGPLPIK